MAFEEAHATEYAQIKSTDENLDCYFEGVGREYQRWTCFDRLTGGTLG